MDADVEYSQWLRYHGTNLFSVNEMPSYQPQLLRTGLAHQIPLHHQLESIFRPER